MAKICIEYLKAPTVSVLQANAISRPTFYNRKIMILNACLATKLESFAIVFLGFTFNLPTNFALWLEPFWKTKTIQ